MSVLMEFAMFPTDKGISVSPYVSKIIAHIRESGHPYQLTPMGTIVETESMQAATQLLSEAYAVLEPHAERVYATAKFDIRHSETGRMQSKVAAVESHIGQVNH